jgi:hypothetical protein
LYLISRSANLTLPIRDTKTDYNVATGVAIKVHPALSAQFQHAAGVPDWAKDAVLALPGWGNGIGLDEDPFTRCGILDTDEEAKRQNWSPEDKKFVEDRLLNGSANGVEYVVCEAPKTAKPWENYDEIVGDDAADKIAWFVDQLGKDPKSVKRYEFENQNRENVIAALEDLIAKDAEDVVGVISA